MLLKNTFSGGTNAAAITAANSGGTSGNAFNTVEGSLTYANATGNRAPMAASLGISSSLAWSGFTVVGRDLYVRIYLRLTSNPQFGTTNLAILSGAGIASASIAITSTGKVTIQSDAGTALVSTVNSITLNQFVRIEMKVSIGTTTSNGAVELRLYNSEDSATATETLTATNVNTTTTIPTALSFGGLLAFILDDVAVTDTTWLGPQLAGTPVSAVDSATLAETSSIGLAPTDQGSLADVAAVAAAASRADSATLAEQVTVTLPAADSATLAELAGIALPVSDSAALVEVATLTEIVGPTAIDSGSMSDLAAVAAGVAVSDLAFLAEQAGIALPVSDSAALVEVATLTLPTSDQGALVETASVAVSLAVTDTASLSEAAQAGEPPQPVAATDTAVLVEAATVFVDNDIRWAAGSPYVEWAAGSPYVEWAASGPYL